MKRRDTMIAMALAIACHAALLFAFASPFREAQILLESGVCGVDMWLVPSPESAGDADHGIVRPDPAEELTPLSREPLREEPRLQPIETAADESPPPAAEKTPDTPAPEDAPKHLSEAIEALPVLQPKHEDPAPRENARKEATGVPEQEIDERPAVESRAADGSPLSKGTDARAIGLSMPRYPYASRVSGEEGRVVISVTIRADGAASDIRLIKSSGFPLLDEAALEAVRRATFIPAARGGVPVESTKKFAFTFRLENE